MKKKHPAVLPPRPPQLDNDVVVDTLTEVSELPLVANDRLDDDDYANQKAGLATETGLGYFET